MNIVKSSFDRLPKYHEWFARFVFVVKLTLNVDHKPKYFDTNFKKLHTIPALENKKGKQSPINVGLQHIVS